MTLKLKVHAINAANAFMFSTKQMLYRLHCKFSGHAFVRLQIVQRCCTIQRLSVHCVRQVDGNVVGQPCTDG